MQPDPAYLRERLADARVMLVFTPELARPRDPVAVLGEVLPYVDIVQVRPKAIAESNVTPARAAHEWSIAALDCAAASDAPPLVIVNDRVDVAAALFEAGLAGVHLGQDDTPAREARSLLGPDPLIGLSTHDVRQIARGGEEPVDYLGVGPIYATATKGYGKGLGAEFAWVASQKTPLPLFAIGGIDLTNAGDLGFLGRVAVGSAILSADRPRDAARSLREMLVEAEDRERG